MTHEIFCKKLKQKAEGLEHLPFPGELGQKIYDSISKSAWQMWLNHQVMLINEYRLNMIDPKAREFLMNEMAQFLFGGGSQKPAGFVPEGSSSA